MPSRPLNIFTVRMMSLAGDKDSCRLEFGLRGNRVGKGVLDPDTCLYFEHTDAAPGMSKFVLCFKLSMLFDDFGSFFPLLSNSSSVSKIFTLLAKMAISLALGIFRI